ncbi:MAG TPA: hypothetical protein VEH27_14760 [Methylomirabilota bacterium]|nr:hypothetical protein [Methylomirabilota bacterium]
MVTISYDGQVIAREPARGIIGFHGNYQLRMENGHVYRTDSSGHTTLLSPGRQIKQCVLSQEKLLLREADKVLVMNISGEIVGQVLLTTPEMQVRCLAGNHVIAVSLGETRAVFAFPIEPLKTSSGVKVGSL